MKLKNYKLNKKNDNFINNTKLKLESEVNQILQKNKTWNTASIKKVLPKTSCWILDYSDFILIFQELMRTLGLGSFRNNDLIRLTYSIIQ